MKERPILFSGSMVRAILDGRKGQTRRVMKIQPDSRTTEISVCRDQWMGLGPAVNGGTAQWDSWQRTPFGPDDRLWVREAWRTTGDGGRADDMPPRDLQPHAVWFEADGVAPTDECVGKLRPSMFMPRWASRITLELIGLRGERLQDISEQDAIAEGAYCFPDENGGWKFDRGEQEYDSAIEAYQHLWDSLNAARGQGWNTNPWVWIIEFKRIEV